LNFEVSAVDAWRPEPAPGEEDDTMSPALRNALARFLKHEDGATLLACALGLGLIALLVAAIVLFSGDVPGIFQEANQGATANP
jgi:Flp pilus assembly pilin Flp